MGNHGHFWLTTKHGASLNGDDALRFEELLDNSQVRELIINEVHNRGRTGVMKSLCNMRQNKHGLHPPRREPEV